MWCEVEGKRRLGKALLVLLRDEEGHVHKPSRFRDQVGRVFRAQSKPEYGDYIRILAEDGSKNGPSKDLVEILER